MTTRRPAKRPTQRGKSAGSTTIRLFELRSYAMASGQRDALNTMFEEHFLDAYETAGARILGVFHDARDPDRWVWIRAFPDPTTRARALKGFYSSDAWLSLRGPANRTIRSSSDAILLAPRFGDFEDLQAPQRSRGRLPLSVFGCARGFLKKREDQELAAGFVQSEAWPVLEELGASPVALFVKSEEPNLYPRARLRSGNAVVWLLKFSSSKAHERHVAARKASRAWAEVEQELSRRLRQPLEYTTLMPQRRSALR
jgi:hypothetical protein